MTATALRLFLQEGGFQIAASDSTGMDTRHWIDLGFRHANVHGKAFDTSVSLPTEELSDTFTGLAESVLKAARDS